MLNLLKRLEELNKEIAREERRERKRCKEVWFAENDITYLQKLRRERNKLTQEVRKKMQSLSDEDKHIIVERYFKGKTWKTIYEMSGRVDDEDDLWENDAYAKKKVDVFARKTLRKLKKIH